MSFTPTAAAGSTIAINGVVIEGVEGIPEFGGERAWIESVPINATAKQFVADIPDFGEITLSGERQKTDSGQNALRTASAAVPGVAIPFVVTMSGSGDVGSFNGIVGSFRVSAGKGQTQRFSSKVKLSGAVSWT